MSAKIWQVEFVPEGEPCDYEGWFHIVPTRKAALECGRDLEGQGYRRMTKKQWDKAYGMNFRRLCGRFVIRSLDSYYKGA